MPEPLWELSGIRVGPVALPRLEIPSLAIPPGLTAVLGPSGSGKSTLLGLLVGYQQPDAGSIRRGPVAAGRLPLFWACSGDALWPGVTARRQLALAAPPGSGGNEALLADFGLAPLAERPPERLSSGERDRLDTARALASDAAVLVLDEPFARCGRAQTTALWRLVTARVRERGQSLLYSTHDPALAADAGTVIELDGGRIAALRCLAVLLLALVLAGCGGTTDFTVSQATPLALPPDGAVQPSPRGLCPLTDGGVVVLDTAGRLLDYDAGGTVRRTWRMPESADGRPEGACELPDGGIAVADTHYHRVVVFNRDGSERARWGSEGDGPGGFRWPVGICCDPQGRIWVSEYGGNDRVQRFDADGTPRGAFGRFGTGVGEFQRPQSLFWREGRLYISDSLNSRIQVWGDDGTHQRDFAATGELPYGMGSGPGGLLTVADYGSHRVLRIGDDGKTAATWGRPGRGEGQLSTPWAATVAADGSTWVADTGNRRLWILKP